jgi:hypothetical protein
VDGVNKSRPADIGAYGLRLTLKNVPNGEHTYRIELRDYAGNAKVVERKFTVAVVSPTTQPTYRPTVQPKPTYYPTAYPTIYPTHTTTPTPTPTATYTPTYTPYPYASPSASESPVISGPPIPSPSGSASPAGAGDTGGGSAGGFVGGTLLAMLPIGAAASYLLLQHREGRLGAASHGDVLSGGGSSWERFKQTMAKSKDLTRPSSRG